MLGLLNNTRILIIAMPRMDVCSVEGGTGVYIEAGVLRGNPSAILKRIPSQ
jgi:hypothetical protein